MRHAQALNPSVSVIVPVYNGARTIRACLESLLGQRYPCEIIVVENGSTDDTSQQVERYAVRLARCEQRGPAAARNAGIACSQAEVIAFTDADCIADPGWVEELVKPYAEAEVGGVGGEIRAYTDGERSEVERFSEEHAPLVNYFSGPGEFLPHLYTANASYRRDLLNQVGGFNPGMLTGEDVDLSWRVQLKTGAKVVYAPQAVVYHHHRASRANLARQYRQYGFGEIMLDTLYRRQPGYPRQRRFQFQRMLKQVAALPRYLVSILLRRMRLASGKITSYEASAPELWFLIESNNLRGKIEALVATRGMRDPVGALHLDAAHFIQQYYPASSSIPPAGKTLPERR